MLTNDTSASNSPNLHTFPLQLTSVGKKEAEIKEIWKTDYFNNPLAYLDTAL